MTDSPAPPEDQPEKPELKPANENPWYLLAMLHEEQGGKDGHEPINQELHAKNRLSWNRFMAGRLDTEKLTWVQSLKNEDETRRFSEEELTPYNDAEMADVLAKFQVRAKNKSATLPQREIDFSNTEFDRVFSAQGFIFSGDAGFTGATFSGGVVFEKATFSGEANFNSATFSGPVLFNSATFSGPADINSATFSGPAYFNSATFSGGVVFNNATFSGTANFSRATFSVVALFEKVIFSGSANFEHATFSVSADFRNTEFSGVANFKWAKFLKDASFHNAIFVDDAYFQHANFGGFPHFVNAKLQSTTSFAHTSFDRHPPTFLGTTLHEGTQWHDARWPAVPVDPEHVQQHICNYERLRKEMETHKKHDMELFFLSKELECKQVIEGPWKSLPSRFYGFFSGYGASVARPFWGLLALFLLGYFLLGYVVFESTSAHRDAPIPSHTALGLSFTNLLSFLPIRKEVFGDEFLRTLTPLAHVVSTGQAILGAVLFFLLSLALRNRFRMK